MVQWQRGRPGLGVAGSVVRKAALVAAVGVLAGSPGCGSTSGDGTYRRGTGGAAAGLACDPGETRACVGPARCSGGQFCSDAGRWSACDCGTVSVGGGGGGGGGATAGSGGRSGSASGGQGGASAPAAGPVGKDCRKDPDCGGAGVFCLTAAGSELSGGGPANGLCVADCSASADACAAIDPGSVCVSFSSVGGKSYCLEGCSVGPASAGAPVKCHGRADVACDDSGGEGSGFCLPVCRGDFDCPGRVCDLGTGFCVDEATLGGTEPIGTPCNPNATRDPCRGFCLALDSGGTAGACTGICSLGTAGCGEDPTSNGPLEAECLFDWTAAGTGDVGDIGYCGALCDCDTDCRAPGRVCTPFGNVTDETVAGRAGYCIARTDEAGKPVDHLAACP